MVVSGVQSSQQCFVCVVGQMKDSLSMLELCVPSICVGCVNGLDLCLVGRSVVGV